MLGGCGTIGDLAQHPHVYGGIRDDIRVIGRGTGPDRCGWLIAPDLPFSLVLDTVVLPSTAIYELFIAK